ncbi:hypothetical protein BCR43DRAFT_527183 [Syncephalastrum racemosum]|uniref:Senescence domain-containing protein n=1 Tax=Syncephalastrum racemosum TaxID=13706 RepID=A0A1X2H210_SYNRA|nr:hypothetical protein BCR43DRAFT_527183 [Syncephalastrum racemosum]
MPTHLYTLDRVAVSYFIDGDYTNVGNGHLAVFSDQPTTLHLRFIDYFDDEKAVMELKPRSQAWLQDATTLVLDRPEGGRWCIDCSDSDPDSFSGFQDLLTYFIKYENRHHLRNALALMNPVTCKVTQVVARNIFLEGDTDSADETDQPNRDIKNPVLMDESDLLNATIGKKSEKDTKVRLLYQTSDAVVSGSDWIAHSLVLAGETIARGIHSQSKRIRDNAEPVPSSFTLSDTDKYYVETFCKVNRSLLQGATNLISKAAAAAASSLNYFYNSHSLQQREPMQNATRHLGVSVFHAAHNVVAGLAMATGTVLASSRDGMVDMIYKKYGQDAGYLAEQALGSTQDDVPDVLVYFDSRGVARQVLVGDHRRQPSIMSSPTDIFTTVTNPRRMSNAENSIVFDDEFLPATMNFAASEGGESSVHPLESMPSTGSQDLEMQQKNEAHTEPAFITV